MTNKKKSFAAWEGVEEEKKNSVQEADEAAQDEVKTSIVKEHLKNNTNRSKKREIEELPEEFPSKLKFLKEPIELSKLKPLVISEEIHSKVKAASQICDIDIQQLTANIFLEFFKKHKDDLNQLRDKKISF